ncbi:MAG: cyclodeaminase/cyclohydrolase family protein [Candidatus Poseidoniales archaeon]
MTEYSEMTLKEYSDALASGNPTPGGGTASAVALSQGAALTLMVCNLTIGKERWEAGQNDALFSKNTAEECIEIGYELAAEDALAFDQVMAAFKMSKDTEDEILERKQAIRTQTLNAAVVPMKTAKMALNLLATLPALASTGNANAVTDVGVAGLLLSAACKGALFNVEINLNSLPDEMAEDLRNELDDIRMKCRDISRNVMHAVHDRMQS